MIEKINNNQISNVLNELSSNQPNSAKTPANNNIDASLQVNYNSLLEKAMTTSQENTKAVQRARQLILSGQLESPENIRAAAESIVKFGV